MTDRQRVQIPDPMVEPTIDVEHAGRILDLGRTAAYEAVRRGDIPSISIGRRRVVPTAKLLAMLGLSVKAAS